MREHFAGVVEWVSRVPGVRGAAVVDARAGVSVVAELSDSVDGGALAALAASVFRMGTRAGAATALGTLRTIQVEADDGHVIVAGADELLLVVLADADAQLGMIRLEASRAAEEVL